MGRKLVLWPLLRAEPALDPRKDKTRGFTPEVMAAQLVTSRCCGEVSQADAERLQSEKGHKRALGAVRFADQTQLGEWLRGLGPEGVATLQRELMRKALALCPAASMRTGGELEVLRRHAVGGERREDQGRRLQLRGPPIPRLAVSFRRPFSRRPDSHRRQHPHRRPTA